MSTTPVRTFTCGGSESPVARAFEMLAAIRLHAARALKEDPPSPEAAALWQAAHGLESLLRNNVGLGLIVEAIASRIVDELGRP